MRHSVHKGGVPDSLLRERILCYCSAVLYYSNPLNKENMYIHIIPNNYSHRYAVIICHMSYFLAITKIPECFLNNS